MEIRRKLDRRDNLVKMRTNVHDEKLLEEVRLFFVDREYGFTPSTPDLIRMSMAITKYVLHKWEDGLPAMPPIPRGRKLWDAFSCRANLDKKHRGPKKKAQASQSGGLVTTTDTEKVPPNPSLPVSD